MNNIEILEDYIEALRKPKPFKYTNEQKAQAIENLIQENKELKEYKKIAELTKISCCTAQNCEALNNAIKNGLENEKLLQENKELKEKIEKIIFEKDMSVTGKQAEIEANMKEIIEHYYTANEDCIPKSKIINLLENEVIDISGFECISARDLQELLEEGE